MKTVFLSHRKVEWGGGAEERRKEKNIQDLAKANYNGKVKL